MIEYNVEEKRIKEAMQQVYRDFTLKYNQIQKLNLSEDEKVNQIDELLKKSTNAENRLNEVKSLDEISTEDKILLGIKEINIDINVDTNVIDNLVSIYIKRTKMPFPNRGISIADNLVLGDGEELELVDTSVFEKELKQYFTEHYYDLLSNSYNHFLADATEIADNLFVEKNGEIIQMAIKHNINPEKFNCFGYQLRIQNGLIAEEDSTLEKINIFYSTPDTINKRIFDIYSEVLYEEIKNGKNEFNLELENKRRLKNAYITFAEKNGIKIHNKDVFEELPIDMKKVKGIASYINRILNENGIITSNMTDKFIAELQKEYSKIMNLSYYNFGKLETVKELLNGRVTSSLYLSIKKDSILRNEEFSPDIAYGTPEYIRNTYEEVMEKIKKLSHTDSFMDGYFEVEKTNKLKEALRRYIHENNIKEIDISIPKAEIDHTKTNKIADTILSMYGKNYEDKEDMRERVLKKIEDKYSEMFYERQTIDLNDLICEELTDMGLGYTFSRLYMQNNFIYIGDFNGFNGQCVYATPEAIKEKIKFLDEKILNRNINDDEKRIRRQLVKYAKINEFDIDIPSLEEIENRRENQSNILSFKNEKIDFFNRDMIPDDPTARVKIELNDSVIDVVIKMSEGVPGACVAIGKLLESGNNGCMYLLELDDMNIRGSQIWQAYKNYCNEDIEKFTEAIRNRDKEMIDFVNRELASVGEEKAVESGASFDRVKTPEKYRFTEEEVEKMKNQRQENYESEVINDKYEDEEYDLDEDEEEL